MDAYLPLCDTVKPCLSVRGNDQPWRSVSDTQTLAWYFAPKQTSKHGLSTQGQKIATFVVMDNPALAGLERLRTFKGWQDNWDAEGSKAPNPDVVDSSSRIFSLLAVHKVPSVTLSAEGHPMFVYGAPLNGEVVVTGIDTIDYFFADDASPEGEDVTVPHGALPDDLIAYLHSA